MVYSLLAMQHGYLPAKIQQNRATAKPMRLKIPPVCKIHHRINDISIDNGTKKVGTQG